MVVGDLSSDITNHVVSVTKATETIHPINPKYIGSAAETILDISDFDIDTEGIHTYTDVSDEFRTAFYTGFIRRNLVFIRGRIVTPNASEPYEETAWFKCTHYARQMFESGKEYDILAFVANAKCVGFILSDEGLQVAVTKV